MKTYPSIDYYDKGRYGENVYIFDKLDGSNIRFSWNKKSGWYKSGTKNCVIDTTHPDFGEAISLFMDKYSVELEKIFRDNKEYRNVLEFTVYCEFYGDNSFAGWHEKTDIKYITLFDVWQYKKGFVQPSPFINDFGHLGIPKFLGIYEYSDNLISTIRKNKFEDFYLKEGVICKANLNKKGSDTVWMVKIKTDEWLTKVKERMGYDALLKEVNQNKKLLI